MKAAKANAAQGAKKASCLGEIQRMQKDREERRKNMDEKRIERAAEEKRNRENGNPGDVDFQRMIRDYREENAHLAQPHASPGEMKVIDEINNPINY